ncbi:MAG: mitochondrial fission ELM1 family protein [Hyphomicrobium sp.]|uniref:mitochondrial fission ELM1 family protein n=1 Tax=Hyphomicrobium sp. TaxID=82 RepID=UPI0039E373F5
MPPPDAHPSALEGRTAWVFSDGKAGHEAQCLGVVEALGLSPVIKRVNLTGIYKLAAPWGPLPPGEGMGKAGGPLGPPWPAFAFATGRTTIPYIRALRRRAGVQTYTVVLMDPKTGPNSADLIWVPEHDRRRGPNVITTLTAPHRFSAERIEALRATMPPDIAALPQPRIACLIGGPNGDYRYTPEDEDRLVQALRALADTGAGLMITTSRRTPSDVAARLQDSIAGKPAIFWSGGGANPYPDFLAHADAFVITADSVSMACEAAATGKPIFIFSPTGGSAKFDRFHAALAAYGATRPLPPPGEPLPTWTYKPLHAAETIADEIRKRWQKRAGLLPGLINASRR